MTARHSVAIHQKSLHGLTIAPGEGSFVWYAHSHPLLGGCSNVPYKLLIYELADY